MSDYTKCPKCGSAESWPEINGHHSYECHSFMTNEGEFGQDDYCRRLAEITAPLRAQLDEISKEFFCYKIASKAYTEDVTAIRAQLEAVTKERDEAREQLEQVILERDAAFEQGNKDAKARDEWAQKRDIAIKERDELKTANTFIRDREGELIAKISYVTQQRDIARAQLEAVTKERDEAMIEASALAVCIYENEYKKQSPNWELGHSPSIVISQINNMYAGITEQLNTARAQRDRAMELLEDCNAERNGWISRCARLKEEIAKEKEGGE